MTDPSTDANLVVDVEGIHEYSTGLESQYIAYQRTISGTLSEQQFVPYDHIASPDSHVYPHNPAAYMESFQKPNSFKSRRLSGIIHQVEETLVHGDLDFPYYPDEDIEIEHKAQDLVHSHSKSFMKSFHKSNSLNGCRHSEILHDHETKNVSERSAIDIEHEPEVSYLHSYPNEQNDSSFRATSRNMNVTLIRDSNVGRISFFFATTFV